MSKKKIVIFSDHPAANSGLARIHRDLAMGIHNNLSDEFEVASLGYGHCGSANLPFPQYHWHENDYFLPFELPFIAEDFAHGDPFIFLTIGDIQRFLPLADPNFAAEKNFGTWLSNARAQGKMKLWGYFPIDAHGKEGKLGPQLGHTLSHYDRRLVPSEWAREIVCRTLPDLQCDVLPHGIDTDIFKPYPKEESQDRIGELLYPAIQWPKTPVSISEEALWIGIVATNQGRKDWGLGVEVVAEIAKSRPVFLWCHVDKMKNEWSILELLSEHNLLQSSMVTMGKVTDETMAVAYSAMDLTLGIGRGEGFGYPIAESLACGTPCIASSYGAQQDYLSIFFQVVPSQLRLEGPLNLLRPLHTVKDWVDLIPPRKEAILPPELAWNNLWPRFSQWLKEGIGK